MGYSGTHGLEPFFTLGGDPILFAGGLGHDCAIFKLQTFEEARPWSGSALLLRAESES